MKRSFNLMLTQEGSAFLQQMEMEMAWEQGRKGCRKEKNENTDK